jgi:plasmid stabilization system protein ParE
MGYKVQINRRFEINVVRIYTYISREWGFHLADQFFEKIKIKIDLLEKHPMAGPPSKKKANVRSILVGKHNRIYYRIPDDLITILTIIDTRTDPNKNPY